MNYITTNMRVLPYIAMFVVDSLLFPILFIGVFFLFVEHSFYLLILSVPKKRKWRVLTVSFVVIMQLIKCYLQCNFSSWVDYIWAGFIFAPVWIGYLIMSKGKNRKYSD